MSGSFEKETTSSTAKSLIGALVALGSGFVFMFLGLVAVTATSEQADDARSARLVQQALQDDLLAYQVGSVSVSKDRTVLKFRSQPPGKPVTEITYKVLADASEVSRLEGGQTKKLAKLPGARFESNGGMLRLHWKGSDGNLKASWALNRWPRVGGGA